MFLVLFSVGGATARLQMTLICIDILPVTTAIHFTWHTS